MEGIYTSTRVMLLLPKRWFLEMVSAFFISGKEVIENWIYLFLVSQLCGQSDQDLHKSPLRPYVNYMKRFILKIQLGYIIYET